jgi:quercetin dioxygenase-like cupin family protein
MSQASRVVHFQPRPAGQPYRWLDVPVIEYKPVADTHCGVTRTVLAGDAGETTAFHVRYFEVAPGGFTTLEHHRHEHVVVVLRGHGEVQLGDAVQTLAFGDTVYVAPHGPHQFRNLSATEPFGFLCIVDADRDRPVPL